MKKIISLFTMLCIVFSTLGTFTVFADEPAADLEISTLAELEQFRDDVNNDNTYEGKTVKLTADIDMSEKYGEDINGEEVSWTPIGSTGWFEGAFNGNGHTISGLYINSEYMDCAGLFGGCGENSQILNLTVNGFVKSGYPDDGVWANPPTFLGGIAGMSVGKLANCCNKARIIGVGNGAYAAGICGSGVAAENCINTGLVVSDLTSEAIIALGSGDNCKNCYYLEGTSVSGGGARVKTAEQFASGEVAFLLGNPWGQEIGIDEYPVLGGKKVYFANGEYTNTPPKTYPYTIGALKLVNESGIEYETAPSGKSFIVDAEVIKNYERDNKDYFIVVVYDTYGAMISLNYIKANIPANSSFSCGINIPKTDKEIGTVKAFVWSSLSNMTPLAKDREFICNDPYNGTKFKEDCVLVTLKTPIGDDEYEKYYLDYFAKELPGLDLKYCSQLMEPSDGSGIYQLGLSNGSRQKVINAVAMLKTSDIVLAVQPDYIMHID